MKIVIECQERRGERWCTVTGPRALPGSAGGAKVVSDRMKEPLSQSARGLAYADGFDTWEAFAAFFDTGRARQEYVLIRW